MLVLLAKPLGVLLGWWIVQRDQHRCVKYSWIVRFNIAAPLLLVWNTEVSDVLKGHLKFSVSSVSFPLCHLSQENYLLIYFLFLKRLCKSDLRDRPYPSTPSLGKEQWTLCFSSLPWYYDVILLGCFVLFLCIVNHVSNAVTMVYFRVTIMCITSRTQCRWRWRRCLQLGLCDVWYNLNLLSQYRKFH